MGSFLDLRYDTVLWSVLMNIDKWNSRIIFNKHLFTVHSMFVECSDCRYSLCLNCLVLAIRPFFLISNFRNSNVQYITHWRSVSHQGWVNVIPALLYLLGSSNCNSGSYSTPLTLRLFFYETNKLSWHIIEQFYAILWVKFFGLFCYFVECFVYDQLFSECWGVF